MTKNMVFDNDRLLQLAGLKNEPRDSDEFDEKPVKGAAHLWQVKTTSGFACIVSTADNDMQQLTDALKQCDPSLEIASIERLGECFGLFELRDSKIIERLVELNRQTSRTRRIDALSAATSAATNVAADNFEFMQALKQRRYDASSVAKMTSQAHKTLLTSTIQTTLIMLGVSPDNIRKLHGLSKEPDEAGYAAIAEPVVDARMNAWARVALHEVWSRGRTEQTDDSSDDRPGFSAAIVSTGNPIVAAVQSAVADQLVKNSDARLAALTETETEFGRNPE